MHHLHPCTAGYEDAAGNGIAASRGRNLSLGAGRLPMRIPERASSNGKGMVRDSAAMQNMQDDIKGLVGGPFYDQLRLHR